MILLPLFCSGCRLIICLCPGNSAKAQPDDQPCNHDGPLYRLKGCGAEGNHHKPDDDGTCQTCHADACFSAGNLVRPWKVRLRIAHLKAGKAYHGAGEDECQRRHIGQGYSMFFPRKGPIMVRTASTVLAILGAPLFSSRTAKLSGSCPLRPMASIMRLVAP